MANSTIFWGKFFWELNTRSTRHCIRHKENDQEIRYNTEARGRASTHQHCFLRQDLRKYKHWYRSGLSRPPNTSRRTQPCVLWKIAYRPEKWPCGLGPGVFLCGHNANREQEMNVCIRYTVFLPGTVTAILHGCSTCVVCIHFATLRIIRSFLLFWFIADARAALIMCV
jgi:hypothetical protein